MTETQAQEVHKAKEALQVAAQAKGWALPRVHQTESDGDGSINLEYIGLHVRIGFNIEIDPAESGWCIVGRKNLMEWGHLKDFDAAKLVDLYIDTTKKAQQHDA